MNPRAMCVHIGRLVLDAPLAGHLPAHALTSAVQAALTSSPPHGSAPVVRSDPHSEATASLPARIAAGIADRLGSMLIDGPPKRSGGHNAVS